MESVFYVMAWACHRRHTVGGQRARVAVMRTLLAKPQALLLGEPFSKLDAALKGDFRRFVFGHARDAGLPTILVTHDEDDAQAAQGPVIRLSAASSSKRPSQAIANP